MKPVQNIHLITFSVWDIFENNLSPITDLRVSVLSRTDICTMTYIMTVSNSEQVLRSAAGLIRLVVSVETNE